MDPVEAVQAYLRTHSMTAGQLARICRISKGDMSRYLSRSRRPGLRNALKIQCGTAGAVKASWWLLRSARKPEPSDTTAISA